MIEWDATNKILYYVQEKYGSYGLDRSGNLVAFSTWIAAVSSGSSSASYNVDTGHSATTNGVVFVGGYVTELDKDSGQIIYVENRRAISRHQTKQKTSK